MMQVLYVQLWVQNLHPMNKYKTRIQMVPIGVITDGQKDNLPYILHKRQHRPGVNGGFFDNPELRFGVNCYGVKPPRNATDELLESQVALPPTTAEIEFDKKVQKFREQLNTITVLPFHKGQWTE
jgi:hypothetical protein